MVSFLNYLGMQYRSRRGICIALVAFVLFSTGACKFTFAQTSATVPTSLQIIHNSADAALNPIDVSLGIATSGIGTNAVRYDFFSTVQNVYFRTNTSPMTAIGDISIDSLFGKQLGVRLSSTTGTIPPSRAYSTLPLRVGKGANVVIAGGVLETRRFVANPNGIPINALLFQFIDTVSITTAGTVRILLFHGVTDAPQIDVNVRGIGRVASLMYGEGVFVDIPTADYIIDMRISTSQTLVGTFVAPLQTMNFAGQRVTLMASGFRNTSFSNNRQVQSQYGRPIAMIAVPTDSLSLAIQLGTLIPPVPPPTTLQLIHNSPDPSFNRMSIWAGASVTTGSVRFIPFIPQFTYRNATQSTDAFVTLIPNPVGGGFVREEILFGSVLGTQLVINPQVNNPRPGQTPNFNRFPGTTITRGQNIIIAHGVGTPTNFAQNPDTTVDRLLRLTTFTDPIDDVDTTLVRVLLFNGVTDSPVTDVVLRETGDTLATLKYGEGKFVALRPGLYTLDFVIHNEEDLLGSFILPLYEYTGQRVTVMSSGFLNSSLNRNGPAFSAVIVSPLPGRVPDVLTPIPFPSASAPTTLQLINNVADNAFSPARVWLGQPVANPQQGGGGPNATNANVATTVTQFTLFASSLPFRQGTLAGSGFGEAIAFYKDVISIPLTFNFTNTTARTATTATLSSPFIIGRGANILIASGVSRPRNFVANPDSLSTANRVQQFIDNFRPATTDIVRIFAYNGLTDAPALEFVARGNLPMLATVATLTTLGTTTINTVTVLTAATFSLGTMKYGSGAFTTLPTADYWIDVRNARTGTTVATFSATMATAQLGGTRITLAASGFWNYSATGQGGNPWRMLAVVNTVTSLTSTMSTVTLATTTTGTIVELITTTTISVPHSFLLPTILTPRSGGVSGSTLALQQESSQGESIAAKTGENTSNDAILNVQTYPNPTTDHVSIQYNLKQSGTVKVSVHDAFGQIITQFRPMEQEAGENILDLDMSLLPRGAYQVLIVTPSAANRVKVMVVR